MKERQPSDTNPRFGLDLGTRTATLAVATEHETAVVPVSEQLTLPVRISLTQEGVQIGHDVDTSREGEHPVQPGTLYEPGGHTGQNGDATEFPIKEFLEQAKPMWLEGLRTDAIDSEELSVVVPIPGGYDGVDEGRLLTAVAAAGYDPLGAIRAPLPTAIADGLHEESAGTYVVANVGGYWFDAAVIEPRDGRYEQRIRSRVSIPNLGLETFEQTITQWLLDQHESSLQDVSKARLRDEVGDALEQLLVGDEDDVPLYGAREDAAEPVDQLDSTVIHRALEGVVSEIKDALERLTMELDVEPATIDGVVVSGGGGQVSIVQQTFEGHFDQQPRPPEYGDALTAPAIGASRLARDVGADVDTVDETLRRELTIELLTENGSDYRNPFGTAVAIETPQRVSLRTTEDEQIRGRLKLASRHRTTGSTEALTALEITGLPAKPAGEVSLDLEVTPHDSSPVDITFDAFLRNEETADARDTSLDITRIDASSESGPWFARSTVELEALDVPDRESYEPVSKREPAPDAYSDLSPKQAIDRIMSIRNELWMAVSNDEPLTASDLDVRLKKLDVGLKRAGVEPIVPEPGDEVDDVRHEITALRESERPKDEIIELQQPGHQIDGRVKQTARVVVSKGMPETSSVTEESDTPDSEESTTDDDAEADAESEPTEDGPDSQDERSSETSMIESDELTDSVDETSGDED